MRLTDTGRNEIVNKRIKYPRPKVIYVDVDGTLLNGDVVNTELVTWLRHKSNLGFAIIVWSARGVSNANRAVRTAGITDIIDQTLCKPGYVVDDKGWSWTKYVKQIRSIEDE